jgi:Tfp pilus assembly protein FimT
MRKSGVTMLELILIIVLLVVFVGILLPTFARPRSRKRASCQSNLKHFGVRRY